MLRGSSGSTLRASSSVTVSPAPESSATSAAPTGPPPTIRTSRTTATPASGAHERFDLGNGLGRVRGDDLAALRRDHRVVLDAHADVPEALRHAVRGAHVASGLDRQHHARFERAPLSVALVVAAVVHVHAQPVAGAVHVEAAVVARFDHPVDAAAAQAEIDEAL